jgi:hypothetical protein
MDSPGNGAGELGESYSSLLVCYVAGKYTPLQKDASK